MFPMSLLAPERLDEIPRCRACGSPASLRRGRCAACYERWLAARPVGEGAACAACGDRRLPHLRHFELHGFWVVLCHNCTAGAKVLQPMPRSVDGLLVALQRERRDEERRTDPPSRSGWYHYAERRRRGRRKSDAVLDATAYAEVIELVADYGEPDEGRDADGPEVTGVHARIDPAEL
jgi:hypothetical protein